MSHLALPRLLYDPDHLPRTELEWNTFTFIDKTHWGYYAWPKYANSILVQTSVRHVFMPLLV